VLRLRGGEPEAAIQLAQRALRVAPARNRWIAHAAIGRAFLSRGEPDQAIPELEGALKQQPTNAPMHFYLAQAYRQAGRSDDAQKETVEFVRLKREQDPLSLPSPVDGSTGAVR